MKLIVAGGRDFDDAQYMQESINSWVESNLSTSNAEVILICGEARGADLLARKLFEANNLPIESFPANWNKYGKRAGLLRNEQMAEVADALIAFWDGESRGTKHMIETMKKLNKPVQVFTYERS